MLPKGVHPGEKQFTEQVIAAARLGNWETFHDYATNFPPVCPHCRRALRVIRNPKGFPDLVLVRDRVLYRELKVKGGRLSPEQYVWRDRLESAGADWAVWTPDDWETINATLLEGRP